MPTTIEYQLFSALNYDWKSLASSNAALQIDSKLKAWVTACNANAGNASKQITVLRDPNSSTGTRTGWVIRFTDGTQPGFMFHFANTIASGNSASGARVDYFPLSGWTDNTANDGYGGITGAVSSDTSIGWYITGVAAEFIIASSTDANQEFFAVGWNMANNISYRDCFIFFKDTNNNWVGQANRSTSKRGVVQNPQKGLQAITALQVPPITSPLHLSRLAFISNGTYAGGEDTSQRLVYPAHPKLWSANTTKFSFGGYYAANGRVFYGITHQNWVVEA